MNRDARFNITRGDKIGCVCVNCGDRYTYTEKVDQDPPRSTSRCPECYEVAEQVKDAMVAGKWTVRDEDVRAELIDAIESETPYEVFVEDRVSSLFVFDSGEIGDDNNE